MAETTSAQMEKRQRVMGWVAITLSTLAAAVLGIVAGERVVMRDWPAALLHSAQMLVIIAAAAVAVRWPRVGGSLTALVGLGLVLEMIIPFIGGPELLVLFLPAALFFLLLIVAGPLYFRGKPSRRRLNLRGNCCSPANSLWDNQFSAGSWRGTPCAKGLASSRGRHGEFWAVFNFHCCCTRP